MQASEVPRAVAAARSIASMLGLAADDAIVLNNSNRIVLRLLIARSPAWYISRSQRSKSSLLGGSRKPRAQSPRSTREWSRKSPA
jgi:hypothetical protein